MSNKGFGRLLKTLRQRTGQTLREFCLQHGFDPGNLSRLERGYYQPPQSHEVLARYATALGLEEGGEDWLTFFDTAAACRGELPKDLQTDEELLEKLPVLFRTLRGTPVPSEKLDELIKQVRRG